MIAKGVLTITLCSDLCAGSGYAYAGLPDIEVYPISKETPSRGHSEVWIAIKKD